MVQSQDYVFKRLWFSQDYVFKRLWFRVRIMCSSGCGSESGLCVQVVVVQSQDYVFKQSDLSTTIVDSVRWQHKTQAKPS